MKSQVQNRMLETIRNSYLVILIAGLGVVAFITAVLVAWPALAYIASKLF